MNSVTGTQYFSNLSDLQAGLDHQALGPDVVRDTGIEPVTSSVSGKRSPAELIARVLEKNGADDGIRTRDPNLGKVVRYQLRHVRMSNELRYRNSVLF